MSSVVWAAGTKIKMSSTPWDTPHLADGAPEPQADSDRITVLNMRYVKMHRLLYMLFDLQVLSICLSDHPCVGDKKYSI